MKRKSIVAANKKGLNYYSPLIAIMGVFILGAILSNLFVRQYKLASEFDLGREQFRVMLAHSSAEKALLFVDNAAKLALENAAYSSGKSGFYYEGLDESGELRKNPCGFNKDYTYWTKDVMSSKCEPKAVNCYPPDESRIKSALLSFFGPRLGSFISNFNAQSHVKAPFDYEPFRLEPVAGRTELVGISKEPLVVTAPNIRYGVKPSFRESIPVDVVANGKKVVEGARQLARKGKGEIDGRLAGLSKDDFGNLKWSLDSYSSPAGSCAYSPGLACTYDCNCFVNFWKVKSCRTCSGTIVRTVAYNDVSALFSASETGKLLVYSAEAKKPEFKEMEYDFGLAWFEPTSCVQTCSGNEPRSCPVPSKAVA